MNRNVWMGFQRIAWIALIAVVAAEAQAEPLKLASVFSHHAVLQRDVQTPIWGVAEPGQVVQVEVARDGKAKFKSKTKADAQGKWLVRTAPFAAGGPYELAAWTSAGDRLSITNVLFGDVWICSGQSNMEMSYGWGLTRGKGDVETNAYANIRLLNVPNKTSVVPVETFKAEWKPCTPAAAKQFSACGYFFGVALHNELPDIPIGLVDVTWSGTYIQTWLSLDSLEKIDPIREAVERRRNAIQDWFNGGSERFKEDLAVWEAKLDPYSHAEEKPYHEGFDDASWGKVALPQTFERHVAPDFDGVVWYRLRVTLTPAQAEAAATLKLGRIDDQDETYVNGVRVGGLASHAAVRRYEVPAKALKAGENVITVRVQDNGWGGGFIGKAEELVLETVDGALPLAGEWVCKVGEKLKDSKPENLDAPSANSFSACYNGMFMPLFPMGVKGAIWYQGCSNVGGEVLYDSLFRAMAADWRANFTGAPIPIYLVQLAAFQATHPEPRDSAWARMRWTMTRLGEEVEHSGTAVTIDVGDHADIHPKDKKTVGERLARLALNRTYGRKDIVEAGPIPTSATTSDRGVVVSFKNAAGLRARDGGRLEGFQIPGADGKFVWADAVVEGETVVVAVPEGSQPTAVRHAWDDYPVCNLVNGEDLPCGPFELKVGE
ncbi:MAG: sialate O-acetylesterase [Kiritimatiellia bacterium]|jgi:sialate O-acetylesterase